MNTKARRLRTHTGGGAAHSRACARTCSDSRVSSASYLAYCLPRRQPSVPLALAHRILAVSSVRWVEIPGMHVSRTGKLSAQRAKPRLPWKQLAKLCFCHAQEACACPTCLRLRSPVWPACLARRGSLACMPDLLPRGLRLEPAISCPLLERARGRERRVVWSRTGHGQASMPCACSFLSCAHKRLPT